MTLPTVQDVELTEKEQAELLLCRNRTLPFTLMCYGFGILQLLFVAYYSFFGRPHPQLVISILLLCCAAVFLLEPHVLLPAGAHHNARKKLAAAGAGGLRVTVMLTETELSEKPVEGRRPSYREIRLPYSALYRIQETRRLFCFYTDYYNAIVLPKRLLEEEQIEFIRNLAVKNTPSAKNRHI